MSSDEDSFKYRKGGKGGGAKITPPPPPPPPTRVSPPEKKGKKKSPVEDDLMQEELKNVLTIFREKRKIEIQRTPEVYVNQHSTEGEVQEWLKQKGFSPKIAKQLVGMNGNELFSLKRSQIENYCGKEEGRRLDSQITISRNTTGYKTARSSELRAILAKARAKVEQGNFENGVGGESGRNSAISNSNSNDLMTNSVSPGGKGRNNSASPLTNPKYRKSQYEEDSEEEPEINFGLTDESDDESDPGQDNKGTLGKMLKKKRGEILRK